MSPGVKEFIELEWFYGALQLRYDLILKCPFSLGTIHYVSQIHFQLNPEKLIRGNYTLCFSSKYIHNSRPSTDTSNKSSDS